MNILIVKTSAIGDVLHTMPALKVLRRAYPQASISWLVEEEASPLVIGHPEVNAVLISRRKRWIRDFLAGRRWGVLQEVVAFIKKLRCERYDLLIDFQGLLKSSLLIACCRARRKVGFGRGMAHAEGSYLFLSEHVPPVDMDLHAVKRELLLLEALGIATQEAEYTFPISEAQKRNAHNLLTQAGVVGNKPLVALNPMTTWPSKHWTPEGFARVADSLYEMGVEVIFTGGPGDGQAIGEIQALMRQGKAASVAGQTDLQQLAALFACCRVVISTDTGPMHLAAAVHTPVVALFGPTAPWRTGPYGTGHQVIQKELDCRPCLKRLCRYGTTQCMRDITADDVVSAVARNLVDL